MFLSDVIVLKFNELPIVISTGNFARFFIASEIGVEKSLMKRYRKRSLHFSERSEKIERSLPVEMTIFFLLRFLVSSSLPLVPAASRKRP